MAEKKTEITEQHSQTHQLQRLMNLQAGRIEQVEKQVALLERAVEMNARELRTLLDMFADRLKKKR